jgi:hypothetical protein
MTTAPSITSQDTATHILHQLGWRVGSHERYLQALRNFQRGWRLGPRLEVTSHLDHATSAALLISHDRHSAGKPTASEHFSFSEFACPCKQTLPSCQGILVIRPLLNSLEKLREEFYPNGLAILSGYRCKDHNKVIHGASTSQHLFGGAADVRERVTPHQLAALEIFSGMGRDPHTGKVDHVDRRDRSGHNTTGSTVQHPAIFKDVPH